MAVFLGWQYSGRQFSQSGNILGQLLKDGNIPGGRFPRVAVFAGSFSWGGMVIFWVANRRVGSFSLAFCNNTL